MFTTGASHMCMLHNCIIRGFNSIWLQAPHITDVDKADFIGYSLTWHKFVKSHHDDEEENLFPKVEDQLADKKVWAESHIEHGTEPPPPFPLFLPFSFLVLFYFSQGTTLGRA